MLGRTGASIRKKMNAFHRDCELWLKGRCSEPLSVAVPELLLSGVFLFLGVKDNEKVPVLIVVLMHSP